ncbi:MAG: hypothetical protein HKN62_16235, partial [Phycisphaerales bacterium]|nr:hypothetical protein [Phycisphaerales bacterium]
MSVTLLISIAIGVTAVAGLLVPVAIGLLLSFRASQRSLARSTAALRESEERLKFTLEETGLAPWEWDPREGVCRWSG